MRGLFRGLGVLGLALANNANSSMPDSFEWTQVEEGDHTVVLTPVQDQNAPKGCHAGWAFASAGTLSDRIQISRAAQGIATEPQIVLSAQALLSCSHEGDTVCTGGSVSSAYTFVQSFGGLPDDSCQPYTADDLTCSDATNCGPPSDLRASISQWGRVSGETGMQTEILARGPIACELHVPEGFENYKRGVIGTNYHDSSDADTHFVAIVGWGVSSHSDGSQEPYWRARNSFGNAWGEDGFFRIARGENMLGIESNCAWAEPKSWFQEVEDHGTPVQVMNEGFEESRFMSLKTHAQVSSFDDDLTPEKVEDVDKDVFQSGVDALDDIIHGSFSGVGFAVIVGMMIGLYVGRQKGCFSNKDSDRYYEISSMGSVIEDETLYL